MSLKACLIVLFLAVIHYPPASTQYADPEKKFESYFSPEYQKTMREERAKKVTGGDVDLELTDEEFQIAKVPYAVGQWQCPEQRTTFEQVIQDEITNYNYNKIMYRYKRFLLYLVATWCDYCCQHNEMLKHLNSMLEFREIEGESIPIVLLRSDLHQSAVQSLNIVFFKVPTLFYVKERKFYQHTSFFGPENIFFFINRIEYPYIELGTIKEVEEFFDTSKEYPNEKNDFIKDRPVEQYPAMTLNKRNRMIGFFADPEEYSAEYSSFITNAEKISYRNDLRIAIVTNRDVIRHFKNLYESVWFNSHSWNSIVVKRIDKYMFLDLSIMNEHLDTFTLYNTISYVDELSVHNSQLTAKISTPIAMFFIDSSFILLNYHSQLLFLEHLSSDFIGKYVFMFIDGNTKTQSKQKLGLKKDMKYYKLV